MSYTKLAEQPGPRAGDLEGTDLGPGLFPNETALRLETGHYVAVSVATRWLEGGHGVAFTACARWITGEGETRTGPEGQHVKVEFSHHAAAETVPEVYTVEQIARELLLAVLGEPPTMVDLSVAEGEAPQQQPLIPLSEQVRAAASIRNAITAATATAAAADPGALLGV